MCDAHASEITKKEKQEEGESIWNCCPNIKSKQKKSSVMSDHQI